jgi:hypothetical protein
MVKAAPIPRVQFGEEDGPDRTGPPASHNEENRSSCSMGLSSEGPKPAPDARASESKGLVPGPKMTARTMREGENGGVGQNCGIRPKLGLHMSFSFFFFFSLFFSISNSNTISNSWLNFKFPSVQINTNVNITFTTYNIITYSFSLLFIYGRNKWFHKHSFLIFYFMFLFKIGGQVYVFHKMHHHKIIIKRSTFSLSIY